MRRTAVLPVLLLAAATPTPAPTPRPTPVFELHRTQQAAASDPAKANPLFVLVIGSDLRDGDPRSGRADSIHVVALNTAGGHGSIVGIPRDAWVNVPGRGHTKLNEALQFGGPEKLVETVRTVSGIPIHYWASAEFSRFRRLVDRLGGVDVDIPYRMADRDSGAYFDPGPRHLNGTEALAFVRNRHDAPGGDVGRSENHGRLLLAGLAKFRADASEPFGLLKWMDAFRTEVATDVPVQELLALGLLGRRLDPANIHNVVVPVRAGQVGGQSVVFLQPAANAVFAGVRDDAVP